MASPIYHPVLLVVEDTEATRELLYDIFSEEGYDVVLASDGRAALEVLADVQPALVTLDLELPEIGGLQVLEYMRRHPPLRDIPVLIVSGLEPIPERARQLAQGVVQKPFQIDELIASVERLAPPFGDSETTK
ncbi:MAG TPA: response regulator [Roseiflexaceae bacterium]|nr:response regulator [Roseiflexaceae bacterium]